MSTQSNPLYDALCKRLIARIIEAPANCDPPTDIDLRLAAIIGERDDLARRNAELTTERDDAVKRMEQGWVQVCAEPAIKHFKDEADRLARRNAELEKAAKAVVWFDWSDNDEDAVAAIAELRALAAGGE